MCPCRSPPTLTGGATPSSTRCTRSPGRTPTATGSATSPGSAAGWRTWPGWAWTPSGSPPGTPRRRPTAATTSPTSAAIDPMFGDVADVEALVAEAHDLGIKVIVDIVPNHSSDQHAFFQEALASEPGSPAWQRYHCVRGRGRRRQPAQRLALARSAARAWDPVLDGAGQPSGWWYLHLFDSAQPDLNWEHPDVRAEFEETLRFWFDRGIDGFRIDVATGLVKAPGYPPLRRGRRAAPDVRRDPGLPAVGPAGRARGLARVAPGLQRLPPAAGRSSARSGSATDEALAAYIRPDELHTVFNFDYLKCRWDAARDARGHRPLAARPPRWSAPRRRGSWRTTTSRGSGPGTAVEAAGAADAAVQHRPGPGRGRRRRPRARPGPRRAGLHAGPARVGLPLPGPGARAWRRSSTCRPSPARTRPSAAPAARRASATAAACPMPWTRDGASFGFSPTGASWLPMPAHWGALSVEAQTGDPDSTLELTRRMLRLRRAEPALGDGDLHWVSAPGDTCLVLRRPADDEDPHVLVAMNLGTTPRSCRRPRSCCPAGPDPEPGDDGFWLPPTPPPGSGRPGGARRQAQVDHVTWSHPPARRDISGTSWQPAVMRKLFDAPADTYRVADPQTTADRAPDHLATGTPAGLRDDLVDLLGDPDVVLSRGFDLVRFATDASPYRMFPQVVVLARDISDIQTGACLRARALDPGDVPRRRDEPVRAVPGRRDPRGGHAPLDRLHRGGRRSDPAQQAGHDPGPGQRGPEAPRLPARTRPGVEGRLHDRRRRGQQRQRDVLRHGGELLPDAAVDDDRAALGHGRGHGGAGRRGAPGAGRAGDRRRADARSATAILADPATADRIRDEVPDQEHDRLLDERLPRLRHPGADPAPADGRLRGHARLHRRGGLRHRPRRRPPPHLADAVPGHGGRVLGCRAVRRRRGGGRGADGPRVDRGGSRPSRGARALGRPARDGHRPARGVPRRDPRALRAVRGRRRGAARGPDPAGADDVHPRRRARPPSTG